MTPFRVKVDPSHDASKVKAEGPGLSRSGKNTKPEGANKNRRGHIRLAVD